MGPWRGLFSCSLCTFRYVPLSSNELRCTWHTVINSRYPYLFVRRGFVRLFGLGTIVVARSPTFCTYLIIRFCLPCNATVVPQCMVKLVRPIKLFSSLYYDCDCTYYTTCTSDNSWPPFFACLDRLLRRYVCSPS